MRWWRRHRAAKITLYGKWRKRPALNDLDWFVSSVRFLIDRSHAITCKADMNQHVVFKNRGAKARMLLALTSWSIFLVFAPLAYPPLPFCPVQEMKENLPLRAPTVCSGVAEHLAHQASAPTPDLPAITTILWDICRLHAVASSQSIQGSKVTIYGNILMATL